MEAEQQRVTQHPLSEGRMLASQLLTHHVIMSSPAQTSFLAPTVLSVLSSQAVTLASQRKDNLLVENL